MKRTIVLILLLIFLISACSKQEQPPVQKDNGGIQGGQSQQADLSCGGIAGKTCAQGYECKYAQGAPSFPDEAGTCVKKQCFCIAVYEPVCGSNGKQYSNECFAKCEGVDFKAGECVTS